VGSDSKTNDRGSNETFSDTKDESFVGRGLAGGGMLPMLCMDDSTYVKHANGKDTCTDIWNMRASESKEEIW
jgi:hypothetical protein